MALVISQASYRYAGDRRMTLRAVDVRLEPGQVVGVVGGNGAGKSTLCLVAVGLAPAIIGGQLDGSVTIDSLATASAPMHQLAQRAGILFQDAGAQLSGSAPSVWEEVAFGPRNLALPLGEVVERTWSALDALGIAGIAERDPGRLSGGQAQLVALAGVLALRPAYLVLDEPTSQLDPAGTRLVAEALTRAAQATGAGVLLVEHKTELLAGIADEVLVIADGAIVRRGPAIEILADTALAELGVAPPAEVALRRTVEEAGLNWDDAWAQH